MSHSVPPGAGASSIRIDVHSPTRASFRDVLDHEIFVDIMAAPPLVAIGPSEQSVALETRRIPQIAEALRHFGDHGSLSTLPGHINTWLTFEAGTYGKYAEFEDARGHLCVIAETKAVQGNALLFGLEDGSIKMLPRHAAIIAGLLTTYLETGRLN